MKDQETISLTTEINLLISIALPTVALQLFVYIVFTQAASSVGLNLGTDDLAGYSLASLTGNLFCLSTIIGSLSATDTLMPRAFGLEQYEEVGRLAIRGYLASFLALLPVFIPLVFFIEPIFLFLGQDEETSKIATGWLHIYLIGVPFVALFRVTQRFLSAQNIVLPMVLGAFVGSMIVAPLIMDPCVKYFGLKGSAIATVIIQIVESGLVLLYLKIFHPHHPLTWTGFSNLWKDAIKIKPMLHFLNLSTGGVISFTEWWFWETICFTAGKLGVLPFCVHSIAYQILPLCYMIPLGISLGLTVRMGALFSKSVTKVKLLVKIVLVFTFFLAGSVTLSLYIFRERIIQIFTNDENVVKGCNEIWGRICIDIFILYFFCINSYITRALGQQWRLAGIIIVTLWMITLPIVYYICIYRGGGLVALWTILPIAYTVLNINLVVNYVCFTDWEEVGEYVRTKQIMTSPKVKKTPIDENTHLLNI